MSLYVQYPDLTEIVGMWMFSSGKTGYNYGDVSDQNGGILKKVKTEFAFGVATPEDLKGIDPEAYGFKKISMMNNWYPGHLWHKRALTLFFWERPKDWAKPDEPAKVEPKGWLANDIVREAYGPFDFTHAPRDAKGAIKYDDPTLREDTLCYKTNKWISAGGCGFKLAVPPLRRDDFARYFTLLRMPLEVTKKQKIWLDNFNFRKIASGTLASYWANGWKPDEYSTEKEEEFFLEKGINTDPSKPCKIFRPITAWQHRDGGVGGLGVREGLDIRKPDSTAGTSTLVRVPKLRRLKRRRSLLVIGPKTRRKVLTRKVKPFVDSDGVHNRRTLTQAPSARAEVKKFSMPKNIGQVGTYDAYARKMANKQREKVKKK